MEYNFPESTRRAIEFVAQKILGAKEDHLKVDWGGRETRFYSRIRVTEKVEWRSNGQEQVGRQYDFFHDGVHVASVFMLMWYDINENGKRARHYSCYKPDRYRYARLYSQDDGASSWVSPSLGLPLLAAKR